MATESRNAPPNPRCILRGVGVPVTYLTFPHGPDHLYAAGEDGCIHLWDMKRRRIKFTLEAHKQSSILWMGMKEESLLTQGRDGMVKIWSFTEAGWHQTDSDCGDEVVESTDGALDQLTADANIDNNFAPLHNENLLQSVVSKPPYELSHNFVQDQVEISCWNHPDVPMPTQCQLGIIAQANAQRLTTHAGIRTLRDCFYNGKVVFTNISTSGCLKCGDLGFCRGTILSADDSSKWIGISSEDYSQLDLYDLRTRKNIGCLKHSGGKNKVGMIMVLKCRQKQNEQSSEILIGYEDGSITLWDIRMYKLISEAQVHTESVMCMDYSYTANKGISGSTDDKLCTWTVKEESKISVTDTIQVKNSGFNDILIRTDDKVFGVAGWDKQVRLFGLKKNRPLALLSYHRENVQCLAYAEDNTFACGSRDSLISIWDIYKENK